MKSEDYGWWIVPLEKYSPPADQKPIHLNSDILDKTLDSISYPDGFSISHGKQRMATVYLDPIILEFTVIADSKSMPSEWNGIRDYPFGTKMSQVLRYLFNKDGLPLLSIVADG